MPGEYSRLGRLHGWIAVLLLWPAVAGAAQPLGNRREMSKSWSASTAARGLYKWTAASSPDFSRRQARTCA